MSERMMLVKKGDWGSQDVWEVLSPDMREREYMGTYEDCCRYLRNQCPNGSCEE